jgi:hypothetical protein
VKSLLSGGAVNDSPFDVFRKHLNQALKGPGWQSIVAGISAGDGPNWENARLAFDQLFLSTASGEYLVKRASDVGQRNPAGVDLSDELFRKLAIVSKTRKLTQEAILEVLEVFYGRDACRASVSAAGASPYALSDQDDLTVLLDEKQSITIVFDQVSFQDIGNATALEVATVINRVLKSSRTQALAVSITDESTGLEHVRIYSGSLGLSSSVRVTGGKAQTQLLFPTSIYEASGGSPFAVWNITLSPTTPGNVRFTETQVSTPFDLFLLQPGDLAYIYGAEFGASFNQGTFVVQAVDVSYSGVTKIQWFEITNPAGTAAASVPQTLFTDLMLFRPSRSTVYDRPRHVIVSQSADQVDIIIPATTQIVNRTPPTAAYLKSREALEVTSLVRTDSTLTIQTATAHGLKPGNQIIIDDMIPTETGPSTIAGTPSADYVAGSADGTTDASIKSTTSEAHTFEGVYHKTIRLLGGELMLIGGQTQVDLVTIARRTDLAIFEKVSESVLGNGGRQQTYRWLDFRGAPAPGPRFWFKADAGISLSGSDVTAWADQSGNGFNASDAGMPGGSRHLQFNPTSTNGLPGLTGSQAASPQALIYTPGNVYTGGAPRTVFAVVKFGGTGAFGSLGGFVFTFRRSAPEFGLGVFTHGPPDPPGHQVLYTDFSAPTTIEATTPVDYSGQAMLLRWQTNVGGTTLSVFKNGVAISTVTNTLGGEIGDTGFIIGSLINDDGHAVFEGDINEIIGYDGVLSGGDITLTENYLKEKWGL